MAPKVVSRTLTQPFAGCRSLAQTTSTRSELGNRVMRLQEIFLSKTYSCNSDDHCSMFHFHYKQRSWLQSLNSPDYKSMQQLIQHAPVMKMPHLSIVCCHGPDLRAGCRLPLGKRKSKFGRYHTKETLKFFTLPHK